MAKILVIRKPDKTIHTAPLVNKAALLAYNNRSKLGWKIEEMEEEDAKDLPFIDPTYVTAAEAQSKVKELEKVNQAKEDEIAELKEKLAALQAGGTNNGSAPWVKLPAAEAIAKINEAATADEVKAILGEDDRATVQKAASEKLAALEG